MIIKIEKVVEGVYVSRPLDKSGFIPVKAPEDGVIISTDIDGQLSLYLRNSDLRKLLVEDIDVWEIDSFRVQDVA